MSPSAHKGDIAGIKATMFPDTGNSFLAIVEFGDRVSAS